MWYCGCGNYYSLAEAEFPHGFKNIRRTKLKDSSTKYLKATGPQGLLLVQGSKPSTVHQLCGTCTLFTSFLFPLQLQVQLQERRQEYKLPTTTTPRARLAHLPPFPSLTVTLSVSLVIAPSGAFDQVFQPDIPDDLVQRSSMTRP